MRRLESSVPHRLGRRTSFIPSLHGSSAKWAEVIDAADDPARRTAIGSAVVATLLVAGPDGQPVVETADVTALKAIVPDQLFAVRRPVSHKGMKNYISRVAVPTELDGARAVWCESFNELSHLRDLGKVRLASFAAVDFRSRLVQSRSISHGRRRRRRYGRRRSSFSSSWQGGEPTDGDRADERLR